MQSLEIISINLWQVLISLVNLIILFLLLKKFLYKPVKKAVKERQDKIENQYSSARETVEDADKLKEQWEEKMLSANDEAEQIRKTATKEAGYRSDKIVLAANEKANDIIRAAENEAKQIHAKAEAEIKNEIVEVSLDLTEKILRRDMDKDDHKMLIDSFIKEIEEDESGK